MEMLTNLYKNVDKLWTKYKNSWTTQSCLLRDGIILILIILIILFI
tara:strand:- start:5804 stop:5941 length:138 start_codon:yes stop_codon:yes gene_type:complete